ncbi:MAG: trehalose-phosphatase, partial [Actinomycetota bacterium]
MEIDDLIEVFRKNAETGGFVIDFDGTLSPIVADPDEARLAPGASEVLSGLAGRYEVVAIVSGRRAPDIARKIAVARLRYIGLYGAEEWIDGRVVQPPQAPEWMAAARQLAGEAAAYFKGAGLAGCEVELKGMAVSLHFRNAEEPRVADNILEWAQDAAPSRRFMVSVGRKVVELRPQGVSKAGAFERLVDELKL